MVDFKIKTEEIDLGEEKIHFVDVNGLMQNIKSEFEIVETDPFEADKTQSIPIIDIEDDDDDDDGENREVKKEETGASTVADAEMAEMAEMASIYDKDMHGLLYCLCCKEYTRTIRLLLNHQCPGHGNCGNCDTVTSLSKAFKQHKDTHRIYKCSHCGEKKSHIADLNLHLSNEHKPIPFQCNFCTKSFVTLHVLMEHKRSDHYPSILPPMSKYPYDNTLLIQEATVPTNRTLRKLVQVESYECLNLQQPLLVESYNFVNLQKPSQVQRYESLQNESYRCPTCHKCFPNQPSFQDHLKVHTSKKPYRCAQCNKYFSNVNDLNVHKRLKIYKRIHEGLEPYKCYECGQTFKVLHEMNTHERTQHLKRKIVLNEGTSKKPCEEGDIPQVLIAYHKSYES